MISLPGAIRPLVIAAIAVWCGIAAALPSVPPPPPIAARGYILTDFQTGQVLARQNEHSRLEPASLTKLMTAYVVFRALKENRLKLTDDAFISPRAWKEGGAASGGSASFLPVNSRVPIEILIQGMIIQSGNDASIALAEHLAGSEEGFADLMNQTARALGMNDSHFMNSAGLPDPQHYASAADIATLARAIIRDFPEYYRWYSQKEFTYNGIKQGNRNLLLYRDPTVDGLKTGFTDNAGYCLASSARRGDMRLISVVMGTASANARATASEELLNYGFRVFESRRLFAGGKTVIEARVWKGVAEKTALGLRSDLWVTAPRGSLDRVQKDIQRPRDLIAPVNQNAELGAIKLKLDGQLLTSTPLVALAAVPQGSLWRRAVDTALLWFE
jgi:D-alanyl-D-alanine carboxypeptidase (penicillin-binding protein 5/6)